jgi:hypothetical protein
VAGFEPATPRPEQVTLSECSVFAGYSDNVRSPLFLFGFVISAGKLSGWTEGVHSVSLMIRVMVTIDIDECLLGHT